MSTNNGNPVLNKPGKNLGLYGYPIAHSASPAFHNLVFSRLGEGKHYGSFSTSKVISEMLEILRSDTFGGCSVTMPIKGTIIPYLDEISPESRETGTVNTIVKVPSSSSPTKFKLVGTNTDILGVHNALLRSLRLQHPSLTITSKARYPQGLGGAGVVIGGGATTRSAVYALSMFGLHPIYLVNRDKGEVEAVQQAFPHLVSRGSLVHLNHPDQVESLLAQPTSPRILMIVGAIPALAPVTKEERMVYTTASSILSIPYNPGEPEYSTEDGTDLIPIPTKRLFLEMAYKPRNTPMLRIAAAHGWEPIDGVQAMIEQGYAQQRMWARGDTSVQVGSDPSILGPEIEAAARELAINMSDHNAEWETSTSTSNPRFRAATKNKQRRVIDFPPNPEFADVDRSKGLRASVVGNDFTAVNAKHHSTLGTRWIIGPVLVQCPPSINDLRRERRMNNLNIAGSSQGLENAILTTVLEKSERVVATQPNPSILVDLQARYPPEQFLVLRFDVTMLQGISEAFKRTEEYFRRLHVVVNNAKYIRFDLGD
ncbi:hypothetical protein EW146_g3902 [Bondarzewia mesenterica]|uniref:Shikimate dehydrogenase substrate binding N-terminal domain-containing protein n=1 Tax=Bondarzewia mesenterica TaxID=1095465 RepID=A0A4S4LW38_9AGAM|nr:hypothetical protein EW146_g3902 [Bondarzewia mesenterica]